MKNRKILKKISALAAVIVLSAGLLACGGGAEDKGPSDAEEGDSSSKITGPIVAPGITEKDPGGSMGTAPYIEREITISFIGDMCTDHFFRENYDRDGINGVLAPEILEKFEYADIFVANHEYCTTDLSDDHKLTYQTWIERAPVENDAMLKDMSLDLVSLANNHAFDYGLQGFKDTLATLKDLDIRYVGGGMDVNEAVAPAVFEIGSKSIAFFSASSLLTERALAEWTARENQPGISVLFPWYDTYPLMEENIKAAKEKYDYVIALTHWGVEGNHMFNQEEQNFAHMLIDAGVDVIIGGHAHAVQGVEYYNDGVVFYGLGNFLFAPEPVYTMVVSMTISKDGELGFKVTPCKSAYYYVTESNDGVVYDIINSNSVNAKVLADGTVTKVE